MSCDIRWDSFEQTAFQAWSKELLYDSLNSGKRPHILSSDIEVKDLSFGDSSPTFEILEIGDLGRDKFRGIFKLKYDGDAHITLSTSIQANLLRIYNRTTHDQGGDFALPKFPLAAQPFSMPLFLSLSNIRLSGIIVVVFSKAKGLTLVFKNDPLENIKVSSSFDNVQVIEKFLQKKIETQIRDLFRDILPGVLHKVSQKWTTSNIINQLHSKMNDQTQGVERVSIFEVNPEEPELSPANMLRLSTLNRSRQSFRISIPPFADAIERPALSKYDAKSTLGNAKNIRIEVITNSQGYQLDDTLNKLTKIQSKNFLNEKTNSKPHRRSIKLGKTKSSPKAATPITTPTTTTPLLSSPSPLSDLVSPTPQLRTVSMNTEATLVDEDERLDVSRDHPLKVGPSLNALSPSSLPAMPSSSSTSTSPSSSSQRQSVEHLKEQARLRLHSYQSPTPVTPSPMLEKMPLLQRPSISSMKTAELMGLYSPSPRSQSPRKSQSNLLNIGLGIHSSVWGSDAPPPPYTHA